MRSKRDPDRTGHVGWPSNNAEIKALPSTERAGRSTDATVVVCDEWEFHPHAEKNFGALKPTVDAGKAQFIALSTADKTKMDTFFKETYNKAKDGFSNFKSVFLPWNLRPDRSDEWYEGLLKDMPEWQREAEYPATEDDALSTLKSRKFFDEDSIARMSPLDPIETEEFSKWKGVVNIYKLPVVGRKYCLFNDPSDGKDDPHAIVVRDNNSKEWVAISHGKTTADQCALIHDELVRYYNNAWNSNELNASPGGKVDEKLKELGTPNRCPFIDTNGTLKPGKYGWWTAKKLRDNMLYGLEENIRLGQDIIYSEDAIKELSQFFVPEGEDPQHPRGGHDDIIIAGGGVIQIAKYMPVGAGQVKSYSYTERR